MGTKCGHICASTYPLLCQCVCECVSVCDRWSVSDMQHAMLLVCNVEHRRRIQDGLYSY